MLLLRPESKLEFEHGICFDRLIGDAERAGKQTVVGRDYIVKNGPHGCGKWDKSSHGRALGEDDAFDGVAAIGLELKFVLPD